MTLMLSFENGVAKDIWRDVTPTEYSGTLLNGDPGSNADFALI